MSELKTVLGFEAAGAIATLTAMETSLRSWTTAMRNAASAASTFNKVSGIDKGMNSAATSTEKAEKAASRYYNKLQKESKTAATAVESGAKKQEEAGKRVLLSWQSVVRIFAIQVIHQAVTRITTAMWEGVSAARDYEISLAEIQTIGEGFRADFEGLAAQVREFSNATGAPIEGVAEGVYQTLSNQVTDTAHAFDFMTASQAFATASVTETSASVALLSSVINSYNENIDQATKIGGKLAKIIQLGRLRGEEFADSFGKIIVLAAQIGISFDEVGAAIATLTVSGLKYNEASTLMLNIMLKLIRPTEELQKRYTELGIASSEAGIQAYGFQGFLDKLSEKAGTSATELGKLFNRVRAIRGVMGLANENADKYAENLEEIKAAGADELFEKRDIIFETNASYVNRQLNELRNTMVDGFGRNVNVVLGSTFAIFGGAIGTMEALAGAIVAASITLAILKAEAIATAFAFAGITLPIAGLVIGAAVVTAAVTALFNHAEKEREEARKFAEEQDKLELKQRLNAMSRQADEQKEHLNTMLSDLQKYQIERTRLSKIANENVGKLENLVFGDISNQLSSKISEANSFFDNLEKKATTADSTIKKLSDTIQLVQFNISDFNFERSTRGLEPVRKAFAEIERSSELRRKALAAARKGEFDLAEVYNQRAKATAASALNTADESQNRSLISKAVKEVEKSYKSEIAILEAKKKLTAAEKTGIEAAAQGIFLQRQELMILKDELKELPEAFAAVKFDPIKRAEIIAQAVDVADAIQAIFKDIKIDFGIRNAITGDKASVKAAVADALGILSSQIDKAALPMTDLDRKIRGIVPGAKTDPARQTGLLDVQKITNDTIDATRARAEAEANFQTQITETMALITSLHQAYRGLNNFAETQAEYRSRDEFIAQQPLEAHKLAADAIKGLQAGDLDATKFTAITDALADMAKTAGDPNVSASISALITKLNELANTAAAMQSANLTILSNEEFMATETRIKSAHELLGPGTTSAAAAGAAGVATAEAANRRELAATEAAARKRNAALAAGAAGAASKRFGGLLYRAGGGFTPRGTDTIPAMLSPGEYVMDAANTRRFYSQLQSMSAGVQPQYHAQGGPVTNIGDIAITVNETASAQQTARETMQAFRRQTRRRTATL